MNYKDLSKKIVLKQMTQSHADLLIIILWRNKNLITKLYEDVT